MLYQIVNLSVLILVIWLSYITTQNNIQIIDLQQKYLVKTQQEQEFQQYEIKQLKGITEFISAQQQASLEVEKIQVRLQQHTHYLNLQKTYANLLLAELLQKELKFKEAVTLLAASKDTIWQSGDLYPEHKEALQGLMQAIDESVQHWNSSKVHSIQAIYQKIQQVLQASNPAGQN